MEKLIVNLDRKKAKIAREIYGQFAEHLGRCIYEGVYVGEDSDIPNVRGIRTDVVEALKHIKTPIIRWPGGCFADEYHWQDGIGPKENRPSMVNSNWGGVVEDNSFGTHEFMDLCEQVGAEPYINGNVGSGTVLEMQQWIEYLTCNDMNSSMAQLRKANGREEAWKLKWFGVGNENWGCGGNMCPNYYAQEYKRYQTFVRNYGENKIEKIACGPNVNDYMWMETMIKSAGHTMDHITLHHYTFDGIWEDKGKALEFDDDGYLYTLHNAYKMEDLIQHHLSIMDRYDPERRIGLIVDEWGTWHRVEEDTHPGFLYQQNALRDALVASMTLDIFNQHADRITMANIAQMVNVLQAMILTDKEKMILTPTYHVFDLYKDHQDAELLDSWCSAGKRVENIQDRQGNTVPVNFPEMTHTASMKDEVINITLSNFKHDAEEEVTLELFSAENPDETYTLESASILYSESGDLKAHNSFENPEQVSINNWDKYEMSDSGIRLNMPAASIVKLSFKKA